MVRPLAAFERGIDYSGFKLPSLDRPAKFGARFVLRYSAGAASDPDHESHGDVAWKLCGRHELRRLVAAGYDFVANSEWTTSRITEGADAGAEDGAADLVFWRKRGLAAGASIYVSWDQGQPAPHKHRRLAAYLRAYQKALRGHYHVDLYAGDVAIAAMLERGLIRYGWRAMSDSWSSNGDHFRPGRHWKAEAKQVAKVSPAHIWQTGNSWFGGGADENVILAVPIGSHREALNGKAVAPKPDAAPKPPVLLAAPTPVPPTSGDQATAVTGIYRVKPGDNMSAIADRYGMTLDQLEKLNPRAGHPPGHFRLIRPGDRLTVRGPRNATASKAGGSVQIVEPGDTLAAIAESWGVSLAAVKRANPRAGHPAGNFNLIRPGDRIVHP
jgi:LysM repeat protein